MKDIYFSASLVGTAIVLVVVNLFAYFHTHSVWWLLPAGIWFINLVMWVFLLIHDINND